jgi:hypothetical protein
MNWENVLYGAFGGCLIHLIPLLDPRTHSITDRPDYGSKLTWLAIGLCTGLGAVFAYGYESMGTKLNFPLAVQLGLTAPLACKAWVEARKPPVVDAGEGA